MMIIQLANSNGFDNMKNNKSVPTNAYKVSLVKQQKN